MNVMFTSNCIILYCIILYSIIFCQVVLYIICIMMYHGVLSFIIFMLCYIVYIILYCIILSYNVSGHIISHNSAWHFTALYCIMLNCIMYILVWKKLETFWSHATDILKKFFFLFFRNPKFHGFLKNVIYNLESALSV